MKRSDAQKLKSLATEAELEEWWEDAITNCYERMENPSEEEAENWATFCVEERLKQRIPDNENTK